MSAELLRDHLDTTDTVWVITRKADGEERSTPIWAVVVDGRPFIRSVDGADGVWFKRAVARGWVAFEIGGARVEADVERVRDAETLAAFDAELETKYARQRASVASMLRESARDCTLRLAAREG